MARLIFLQNRGSSVDGVYVLLRQFAISVLSDYSDAAPRDMADIPRELAKAGLSMHDLTRNPAPEDRGILISRRKGDHVKAIAFMTVPRDLSSGVAVDICRFDKENRIDTFEVKLINLSN